MRALHLIALATLLFTSVEVAAPNIQITEVEQENRGTLSLLDFFIRAGMPTAFHTSSIGPRWMENRGAGRGIPIMTYRGM